MLAAVKLDGFESRKPQQLSGGQRQRVALARALVKRPKLLLLDEPLGALDKKLREHTQFELLALQRELGTTFVVVTHDQQEAMSLATRIGVMNQGRIVQVGPPNEIYESPASRFVADFIGSVNLIDGQIETRSQDGGLCARAATLSFALPQTNGLSDGMRVSLALRPEKIRLHRQLAAAIKDPSGQESVVDGPYAGVIQEIGYLGESSHFQVQLDAGMRLRVDVVNSRRSLTERLQRGDRVLLEWSTADLIVLTN
jgi:putrescine transport system ATP-binding protein